MKFFNFKINTDDNLLCFCCLALILYLLYLVFFNKTILEGYRNKDKRKGGERNNDHYGHEHNSRDHRDHRREHGEIRSANAEECDEKYAGWQESVTQSLKEIEGSIKGQGEDHLVNIKGKGKDNVVKVV